MKIHCDCGYQIVDSTDELACKGHLIPDQNYFSLLSTIDDLIESKKIDRDKLCMEMRKAVSRATRLVWQCRACGSLYVDSDDKANGLHHFIPSSKETITDVLAKKIGSS